MDTAPTDHMLATARAQRAGTEAPTTAALLDTLSAQLNELEHRLGELVSKLEPVLADETPAALSGQTRTPARTPLANRLLELADWLARLNRDVALATERVEL